MLLIARSVKFFGSSPGFLLVSAFPIRQAHDKRFIERRTGRRIAAVHGASYYFFGISIVESC